VKRGDIKLCLFPEGGEFYRPHADFLGEKKESDSWVLFGSGEVYKASSSCAGGSGVHFSEEKGGFCGVWEVNR